MQVAVSLLYCKCVMIIYISTCNEVITMLLQDIPEDNNLVIELSMNGQKYEFPSKVIRKVNQSVLVEPIRINGKISSFNSSGGGITVSVYI